MDIFDRLFGVWHAPIETPLLQLKVAEVSLSGSGILVLHALMAHVFLFADTQLPYTLFNHAFV